MLPEKAWFTLEEIAKRWNCDIDYLVHIAANCQLEMGVYADWWPFFENPDYGFYGFVQLVPPDLARFERNEEGRPIDLGCGIENLGEVEPESFALIICPGSKHQRDYSARAPRATDRMNPVRRDAPLICRRDLLIRRAERDRFEQAHRIGAHAGTMPTFEAEPDSRPSATVTLPHMNKALTALFRIMADNWTDFDPKRKPKQVNIGAEIDAAMGWRPESDGTPSRNAKALASIIKPDDPPD